MTVAYLYEVSTLEMNWIPSEALMMWRGPACRTVIVIYSYIFPKCEADFKEERSLQLHLPLLI